MSGHPAGLVFTLVLLCTLHGCSKGQDELVKYLDESGKILSQPAPKKPVVEAGNAAQLQQVEQFLEARLKASGEARAQLDALEVPEVAQKCQARAVELLEVEADSLKAQLETCRLDIAIATFEASGTTAERAQLEELYTRYKHAKIKAEGLEEQNQTALDNLRQEREALLKTLR